MPALSTTPVTTPAFASSPDFGPRRPWLRARLCAGLLVAGLLAACGGGGGGGTTVPDPVSCSVPDQNAWLKSYFGEWYFWNRWAPSPGVSGYASVDSYFSALLYGGGDAIPGGAAGATWPRDRWSNFESTASFNRFFGDGQTLGYGVSVAGLEVVGAPSQPLYVRYVEPLSPAATAGVVRGDQVLSLNGRPASDVIAADDFSALTAQAEGEALTLVLRNGGVDRRVTLAARIFALSPVSRAAVVTSPLGRRMGYVVVKDMISQSRTPLATAFADFRAQGVAEAVIDLRYNGGGLVSVAAELAGYAAGSAQAGQVFASLVYNPQRAGTNNSVSRFADPAPAASLGLRRVYVLTGRRTCSASELVINGLRGVGIEVVAIGETTCGKPVGFLPAAQCDNTYSVVNFESVNARGEGRYFSGLTATCPVAEDWTRALGSVGANDSEPLLAAARSHADTGACPPAGAQRERPLWRGVGADRPEAGERQGMMP